VVGGMGITNREQFVKSEYDDQIRDSMRPRTMAMRDGNIKELTTQKGMWDNIR
jgi:hypothetical protein